MSTNYGLLKRFLAVNDPWLNVKMFVNGEQSNKRAII